MGAVLGEIEIGEAPVASRQSPENDAGEAELVDVAFPQMGDSVSEGTVLEWRKQVGDAVAADEVLVEISTDKVDAEVPAPVAGTLAEILVEADETVAVGAVLCRIAAGANPVAGAGAPAEREPGPVQPAAKAVETRPAGAPDGNGNATPVAARIASAHGLDLNAVPGSGPRGRVTKDDVMSALEGDGAPAAPAPSGEAPPSRSAAPRPRS